MGHATTADDLAHVLSGWSDGQGPLYKRLAFAIQTLLESGRLHTGDALPPERKLAAALSISRTTVAAAYGLLRDAGWADARQGSGTRITAARHSPVGGHRASALFATILRDHPEVLDLTVAVPNAAPIVRQVLANPTSVVDVDELAAGHGYNPLGARELREALARSLGDRGLITDPDELLITTGAQQAIGLAVAGLTRAGDTVAMEEVTYPGAIDAVDLRGAKATPVRMTPDGVDPDAFATVVDTTAPRLAYLVPTFHNPTGALLDGARRRAVADHIAGTGTTTVDDMTLAELDYGHPAPPPLAALQPDAPIVTIGSMSKVFWGGLRVGWLRAHRNIITHLSGLKTTADLGGAQTIQQLAASMFEHYEETRAWRNEQLATSLDAVAHSLDRLLPDWEFDMPSGGPHLWIRLPGADAQAFGRHAIDHGVAVVAGPLLSVDGTAATDRIRLPIYATPDRLETAVERLAVAWRRFDRTAKEPG